jgi:hypothetical protein
VACGEIMLGKAIRYYALLTEALTTLGQFMTDSCFGTFHVLVQT